VTRCPWDSGVHEKLDCFAWADGSGLGSRVSILFFSWANVADEVSPLASGVTPAREAEKAGDMAEVPKGRGFAPSTR